MSRPVKSTDERRVKITVRVDPELLAWVQDRTGVGKEFMTITHAIERALVKLRDAEKGK